MSANHTLTPPKGTKPVYAVGYARVSTTLQTQNGDPLGIQKEKLRTFCEKHQLAMDYLYDEVVSTTGAYSADQRSALVKAFDHAERLGGIVVVTDVQRLFRNPAAAKAFLKGRRVKVFSVKDGGRVTLKQIYEGARKGQDAAEKSRAGTKEALASAAVPRSANLSDYGRAGSVVSTNVRQAKRRVKVDDIYRHFLSFPGLWDATYPQVAAALNEAGITTFTGGVWAEDNVRKRLMPDLIAKRERTEHLERLKKLASEQADKYRRGGIRSADPPPDEPDDDEGMKQNPIYGMF